MSDDRAIAAVTATLRFMLEGGVRRVLGEVPVRVGPPGPRQSKPEVGVFLYRVERDASSRNVELPRRNGPGGVISRPQTFLNLHYLLTFYGEDRKLLPELLLGACSTFFDARPSPTAEEVEKAILEADRISGGPELDGCGLPDKAESLRFAPSQLNTAELQGLWTALFQQPYVLSTAYRCSVALEQPEIPPATALPIGNLDPGDNG